MAKSPPPHSPFRRERGFEPASRLLAERIRTAGESRGFAIARLLTQWPEIAGEELARITRPVKISYGREGFGATLTLLAAGARAPLLRMQLEQIRDKVNACYGFNAVARIVLTQTAPTGFSEGQAEFIPAPRRAAPPDPARVAQAQGIAEGFDNPALSAAVRQLALNILSRRDINDRKANP